MANSADADAAAAVSGRRGGAGLPGVIVSEPSLYCSCTHRLWRRHRLDDDSGVRLDVRSPAVSAVAVVPPIRAIAVAGTET